MTVDVGERRLALLLEYDGSRFHGFQVQRGARTVQGVLEDALHDLTGERTRVQGAGRTDAGVHALGQVATFCTRSHHDAATFQRALNARLPEDAAVADACDVALAFDARRHALRRWYRYLVWNAPAPSPLLRRHTAWVRSPLDTEAMAAAARLLQGRHDVASFCGAPDRPTTTVRTVHRAEVRRRGDLVVFDMEADAFLPQQVRRTMGVLLDAGRGVYGPEQVAALLRRPVLGAADHAAPPQGLYLMGVTYPDGVAPFAQRRAAQLLPLALTTE